MKMSRIKKGLLLLALATQLVPATALCAGANDGIEVSGAIIADFRSTPQWVDRVTGSIVSGDNHAEIFLLNMKAPISDKWNAFARFSAQNAQNPGLFSADFAALKYGGKDQGTYFDRWGVTYTEGPTRVTLGRQDLVIGASGLLYDTRAYVGDTSVQGIRAMSKIGKLSWDLAVAGQREQDKISGRIYSPNLRSMSLQYQLSSQFALGAAYVRQTFDGTDWANRFTDASITYTPPGKFKLIAEKVTTSIETLPVPATSPSSWGITGQYRFDKKNLFTVRRHNTEARADISSRNTYPSLGNGWFFDYTYRLDKNLSVDAIYADRVMYTPGRPVEKLKRIMVTQLF